METLDSKQKATLQEYQMVVDANDVNASIQILKDCNWNLQNAINTAFELQNSGAGASTTTGTNTSGSGATQRRTTTSTGISNTSSPRIPAAGSGSDIGSGLGSPRMPPGWAPMNTLLTSSLSFMGPIAHRVLPHWAAESQNVAPSIFTQQLKEQYPDLPNFVEGTYREACRLARNQSRSLFVYIHCQQHEDTKKFIQDSLCNEAVRDYLNANFVCWAGSVTQTDTYKLCTRLRVESYPCIAVVNPHREASRIPMPLHEGLFPPEQMLNWLHEVKQKYESEVAEARRRNMEVKQNSQLREIQDMEYVQALEADRKREEEERRKKELEAVAKMEEKRREAELEKKRKEEEEAEEKRKAMKLKERENLMANEPNAGQGVILVVIRLPDGQQIKRRFTEEEKFETLFKIIQTYDLMTPHGDEIEHWSLRTRYPRKKWEDANMTLKDARMGRQAMFFVQEEL